MQDLEKEEKVNVIAHGSSGTEIYAGYIYEEYLQELRGSKWADIVDRMRRSDPIITMILSSLKLPLLSQNWFIEKKEESPEAEYQKKLFEKVIFEDMSGSFTKTLAEILTFHDFGYSLFEVVHGFSYCPELGAYNTIKNLAFRSQRTIESWKVDSNGKLISVYQEADGDTGRTVNIESKFLVHFSPNMEGDNYEGISKLRPCYGSWLRKNEYLKLMAAGIEKYAIPTPILEVPAEKVSSPEFDNAVEALECYTSNQSAYLTYPTGWNLKTNPVTFDAEKIRAIIDSENLEMTNSVLASFLLLGQGSSGSYSLSSDLSNFFAQTLQAAADHISEVFYKKIMQNVLDLNRPGQTVLCELRCDNLRDKADTEFANTLKTFVDAGLITKTDSLEEFIREKYKYPKNENEIKVKDIIAEVSTEPAAVDDAEAENIQQTALNGAQIASLVQIVQAVAGNTLPRDSAIEIIKKAFQEDTAGAEKLLASSGLSFETSSSEKTFSFAEKKSPKNKVIVNLMDELSDVLKEFFRGSLLIMSGDFINSLEKSFDQSRNIYQASMKVDDPATSKHSKITEYLTARYAMEAMGKGGNLRLSESNEKRINKLLEEFSDLSDRLQLNPLDKEARKLIKEVESKIVEIASVELRDNIYKKLPQATMDQIKAKASVLVDTQASDIYKELLLYSQGQGDAISEVIFQVSQKAREISEGPLATTGPDILANSTISNALYDMSFEEEQGVTSFTYTATIDNDTTDLCIELDGLTLEASDPRIEEYMPPRHYNCRSFWSPNFGAVKVDKFPRLTKAAQGNISLSECGHDHTGTELINKIKKCNLFELAEYKGRQVSLNRPFRTPGESRKFAVYVKNDLGNVVIVRFGDPDMEIKRDDKARRDAFFSRFSCDTVTDKTSPAYWSCRAWDISSDWV